jgi:signal transduction histidine kinase
MDDQWDAKTALEDELHRLSRELELAKARLARLERRKSSLLAMAVHDLRTPLAIIQGFSQLLAADLSPDADADAREYIANIVAHADSLEAMIENLVLFDQAERGELRITCDKCDLGELVDQTIAQVEGLTSLKNLIIRCRVSPNPVRVAADEKQLGRVLYNLLSHATKYARLESELFVEVAAEDGFGWLLLRDPHLFLNDDALARLFDLVENGAKDWSALRGTDMGLVVARYIVEAHGGRLEASCERLRGVTFKFFLPLADLA